MEDKTTVNFAINIFIKTVIVIALVVPPFYFALISWVR